MSGNDAISLRGYMARKHYERYMSLPVGMRTPERTRAVMGMIFDYAYEHIVERRDQPMPRVSYADARKISTKLAEFIGPQQPGQSSIMEWLHENLVTEAWSTPEHFTDFMQAHLRDR